MVDRDSPILCHLMALGAVAEAGHEKQIPVRLVTQWIRDQAEAEDAFDCQYFPFQASVEVEEVDPLAGHPQAHAQRTTIRQSGANRRLQRDAAPVSNNPASFSLL